MGQVHHQSVRAREELRENEFSLWDSSTTPLNTAIPQRAFSVVPLNIPKPHVMEPSYQLKIFGSMNKVPELEF
jgi:hypothetical protein